MGGGGGGAEGSRRGRDQLPGVRHGGSSRFTFPSTLVPTTAPGILSLGSSNPASVSCLDTPGGVRKPGYLEPSPRGHRCPLSPTQQQQAQQQLTCFEYPPSGVLQPGSAVRPHPPYKVTDVTGELEEWPWVTKQEVAKQGQADFKYSPGNLPGALDSWGWAGLT